MPKLFLSILIFVSVCGLLATGTKSNVPEVFSCNATVDAGVDLTACSAGSTVTLDALITGSYFAVEWSPATGLANTQNPSTTATINTTTTYTVTVRSYNTDNLIFNGDFSQGDTGFSSDYVYGTGGPSGLLTGEGQYAIDDNPGDTHSQFVDCNDHSPGTGNMMVVNASGEPDNLWCQDIMVSANTNYDFSAWVTSVVSQNPAQLQFSINGGLLGQVFNASSSTCNWTQFSAQWDSGNNTSAQICIVNINSTPSGNDFALDDITFREICEVTDEITVTLVDLNSAFTAPTEFCANESPVDPATWLATGATPGGTWTIDGNTFTSFDPAVLSQGLHQIVYTVSEGNCSEDNSQLITVNAAPNAGNPSPAPSLCSGTAQLFSLTNLLTGADAGGSWTEVSAIPSTGGAFDANGATFNTAGQNAGTYEFQYSLSGAGCPDATTIVAINIQSTPIADAGTDATLNCDVALSTLGGPNTSTGLDYKYSWTGPDGTISQTDVPYLEAEQAGTYLLEVTNTANGCTSTDEVLVTVNITNINASASISPISCANDQDGAILVDSPTGGMEPYLYSLDGGPFMTSPTFANLTAGQYLLTVMDANGCDTTLSLSLEPPYEFEVILGHNLGTDPPTITLGETVNLDVLLNIPLEKIDSIQWNPEIPDCPGCPSISVTPFETGAYQVTVIDVNGCTASAELTIFVRKDYRIFAPNAISPNEDGVNDIFYLNTGNEVEEIQQLRIMDRWGGLIFEKSAIQPNDPTVGWDGKINGRLVNSGVYVFFAEILLKDGAVVIEKGALNVVY